MTSRQFSERTERTETRRQGRTVRRGLKKRGVLPSFGDIILPIVGIFAVVLLVIAGRQFFLNGMKSTPGISSTRAYAEAPAIIAERERASVPEPVVKVPEPVTVSAEVKAIPEENNNDSLLAVAMPVETPKAEVTKTAPAIQTTKKNMTARSSSNAVAKKTSAKTKTQGGSTVNPKHWRVQVGAYTSRAGAQEAANKIKKAGYNAVVYSNPASKHFKVWVQGGADKKSSENVVKAMQKLGYKGSFSFPPAK